MLISKEHGLNPSLGICFYCGRDNGEILLMGKLKGDVEAPRKSVSSYEVCEQCKKDLEADDHLIAIVVSNIQKFDSQPEIAPDYYPTGDLISLRYEILDEKFKGQKISLMTTEDYAELQKKMQENT